MAAHQLLPRYEDEGGLLDTGPTYKKKSKLLFFWKGAASSVGIAHYRDGRDSRFADAGGIAERVAFCTCNCIRDV